MRLRNLSLLILASPSLAVASPSLKAADPEGVSASKPVIARSPGINLGLEIQGLEPVYAHRDVVLCVEAKNAVLSISDISASGCQVKHIYNLTLLLDKLQFLPEMTVTWDMGDNVTIAYGDNGSCIAAPFTNFRLEWADSEWNYVDDITLPASGLGYISASELQGMFGEYGSVLRAIIGAQRTYRIDPMHLWTSQYYYSVPVTFYEYEA